VLFRQNFLKPFCLLFRNSLVYRFWLVADKELLPAMVTPERSHVMKARRFLEAGFFYRDRPHVLILPVRLRSAPSQLRTHPQKGLALIGREHVRSAWRDRKLAGVVLRTLPEASHRAHAPLRLRVVRKGRMRECEFRGLALARRAWQSTTI